jgi:Asp-tRNA(Asn)/Glu-tRNA(Gln) amidotransferase C subunit
MPQHPSVWGVLVYALFVVYIYFLMVSLTHTHYLYVYSSMFVAKSNTTVLLRLSRLISTQAPAYNPDIRPYTGISELTSSKCTFHRPDVSSTDDLTPEDLKRIANLSYLSAPTTQEEVESTTASLRQLIGWLSEITDVDPDSLPRSAAVETAEPVSSADVIVTRSKLPPFSPLPALIRTLQPENINTSSSMSFMGSPANTLRLRADEVCEGGAADRVLALAKNKDRGYFVVPAAAGAEE